jgi:hypothetical protein
MQEKERWEQELRNATSSYRTMPMWMRRIEEKTRKTTGTTIESTVGKLESKKTYKTSKSK